jgi:hypothetical protein
MESMDWFDLWIGRWIVVTLNIMSVGSNALLWRGDDNKLHVFYFYDGLKPIVGGLDK